MLTAVHVGNFVSGRDHIDYRDNTRNEYDMKRRWAPPHAMPLPN